MAPIAQLQKEKEVLLQTIDQQSEEIKRLELRIKDLNHRLYGQSANRRPDQDDRQQCFQGWESLQEPPKQPEEKPVQKSRKRSSKPMGPKPLDPSLPRREETVEDPALEQLHCPVSGQLMRKGFTETIEILHRIPASFYVRRITRNVWVSPVGEGVQYSAWPKDVLPKSRVSVGIISNVLTERFLMHLPYERQAKRFKQLGIDLNPSTLCSWAMIAARKLQRLYDHLRDQTLNSDYLMVDHSPLNVQVKGRGKVKQGGVWGYRAREGPLFFEFCMSKEAAIVEKTLQSFQGNLQTDGANNFGKTFERENVLHLCCWAHCRRYFLAAEQKKDPHAGWFMDRIDRLFYLERLVKRFPLKNSDWERLRQKHSQPIVEELEQKARELTVDSPLKKTDLHKALGYLLGRSEELSNCLKVVPSQISTNLLENAIRPLKLGAKNWLFIGHPDAGARNAVLFTIFANCKACGIEPEKYLSDILPRIDEHPDPRLNELTPQNWKKPSGAQKS